MAKVQFNDYSMNDQQNYSSSQNQVSFFSLKNDRDEVIVRFIEDDVNDFEILTTHPVEINGKYRSVNCVRDPHEPVDKCPLCNAGKEVRQRIFIKLIRYDVDATGSIVATPCVWERSMAYAFKLKEYISNYGNLSDVICKVIRHGGKGDLKTSYEIIPNLNKNTFRDDLYPVDKTPFNGYSALGTIVLDKSAEDIATFVATGNFPMNYQATEQNSIPYSNQPTTYQAPPVIEQPMNSYSQQFTTPSPAVESQRMPWETADNAAVQRPTRRYY